MVAPVPIKSMVTSVRVLQNGWVRTVLYSMMHVVSCFTIVKMVLRVSLHPRRMISIVRVSLDSAGVYARPILTTALLTRVPCRMSVLMMLTRITAPVPLVSQFQ